MVLGEIRSDDSDEIDRLKKAGAYRGVRRGAAKQVGMFFGLCFDAIQRNGAHNQHGHLRLTVEQTTRLRQRFFWRVEYVRSRAKTERRRETHAKTQRKEKSRQENEEDL